MGKYVYSFWKLCSCEMSQHAEKLALYRFDYQQVIKGLLKGRLLQCKRACIALPSVIYFYNSWYPLVGWVGVCNKCNAYV